MRRPQSGLFIPILFAGFAFLPLPPLRSQESPASTPPKEIALLIRDLSHSSYETRATATRRLCAVGPPARIALEETAKGSDVEAALRAKRILAQLEQIYFAGVEIFLSFSAEETAWDRPVDLRVTLTNRSSYRARVPFEMDRTERAADPDSDARQVADMLDVADWLSVQHVDGREVELRVDNPATEPAIAAVVQKRLADAPSSVLEPGRQVMLTIPAFNRGWARYPLLDRGTYRVALHYSPSWDDPVLTEQRVGEAASNEAVIQVTHAAPETVSRGTVEASLTLERQGAFLVARLTNQTDQTLFFNRNFGPALPFAQGRWVYALGDSFHELPVQVRASSVKPEEFDAALIVPIAAGAGVEIARIAMEELRDALTRTGVQMDADRGSVRFSYSNLCDRAWQQREGGPLIGTLDAPTVFRKPLPRRMFTSRCLSNELPALNGD